MENLGGTRDKPPLLHSLKKIKFKLVNFQSLKNNQIQATNLNQVERKNQAESN